VHEYVGAVEQRSQPLAIASMVEVDDDAFLAPVPRGERSGQAAARPVTFG
jgi:hypothetical protein